MPSHEELFPNFTPDPRIQRPGDSEAAMRDSIDQIQQMRAYRPVHFVDPSHKDQTFSLTPEVFKFAAQYDKINFAFSNLNGNTFAGKFYRCSFYYTTFCCATFANSAAFTECDFTGAAFFGACVPARLIPQFTNVPLSHFIQDTHIVGH